MFKYALLVYLGYICQGIIMILHIRPVWYCGSTITCHLVTRRFQHGFLE